MGTLLLGKEYLHFPAVEPFATGSAAAPLSDPCLGNVEPGDLLLVRTGGIIYSLGRRLTGNLFDHIAVIMENGRTLNIVTPRTVVLPVSVFSGRGKRPLALRPRWESEEERRAFIREMSAYKTSRYNLRKTILGILTAFLFSRLGIRLSLGTTGETADRWICTEAIIAGLKKSSPRFSAIDSMRLDYTSIGFATTNDFLRMHKAGLFSIVKPGPETNGPGKDVC